MFYIENPNIILGMKAKPKRKTIEERQIIGKAETENLRMAVLRDAKRVGLTASKTFKVITDGLSAKEVKTNYDKDRARWAYSDPMVDHKARLAAANLAVSVLGLKSPDNIKAELVGNIYVIGEFE